MALGSDVRRLNEGLPGQFALYGQAVLICVPNSEVPGHVEKVIAGREWTGIRERWWTRTGKIPIRRHNIGEIINLSNLAIEGWVELYVIAKGVRRIIKHSKSTPHGGLLIYLVCKAQSWFPIIFVGIDNVSANAVLAGD